MMPLMARIVAAVCLAVFLALLDHVGLGQSDRRAAHHRAGRQRADRPPQSKSSSCIIPFEFIAPTAIYARRHGICRRGWRQSEQGTAANLLHDCVCDGLDRPRIGTCNGMSTMANTNKQDPRLGPSGAPVPLGARDPDGHLVLQRPGRRRLDEAPLLVRLRHPHPAAVPHRLGFRRQHHGALQRFRQRARRPPSVIIAELARRRPAARGRPQSAGRRHGRGADLRRAGPGRSPACSPPIPTSARSTARSPTSSPTSGSSGPRPSTASGSTCC